MDSPTVTAFPRIRRLDAMVTTSRNTAGLAPICWKIIHTKGFARVWCPTLACIHHKTDEIGQDSSEFVMDAGWMAAFP